MHVISVEDIQSDSLLDLANNVGKKPIFMFVYSDGCYHCQQMKPNLSQAIDSFSRNNIAKGTRIYLVSSDVFRHLVSEHQTHPLGKLLSETVYGFPTFNYVSMLTKQNSLNIDEYKGNRSPSDIVRFFQKQTKKSIEKNKDISKVNTTPKVQQKKKSGTKTQTPPKKTK